MPTKMTQMSGYRSPGVVYDHATAAAAIQRRFRESSTSEDDTAIGAPATPYVRRTPSGAAIVPRDLRATPTSAGSFNGKAQVVPSTTGGARTATGRVTAPSRPVVLYETLEELPQLLNGHVMADVPGVVIGVNQFPYAEYLQAKHDGLVDSEGGESPYFTLNLYPPALNPIPNPRTCPNS